MYALQKLAHTTRYPYDVALVVEPDHIHIHLGSVREGVVPVVKVMKWGIVKPLYPDSQDRSQLPLIDGIGPDFQS